MKLQVVPGKTHNIPEYISSCGVDIFREGSTQDLEYELTDFTVFSSSNLGKTNELVTLFNQLKSMITMHYLVLPPMMAVRFEH